MGDINRILVVSGITIYCQNAVHYGISLSRKYDADLYIIHITHNPFGLEGWNVPMVSLKEEYDKIIKDAKQNLNEILTREKAEGLSAQVLMREGRPTEEILKVIKEENIDLLIMLAHEESRLEHFESILENFLFGRSNEELIRKMPCPILLVKPEP
jgi:universal stress protein A